MKPLIVVTWNIFWGLGYPSDKRTQAGKGLQYFRYRKDRAVVTEMAAALQKIRPQIVGLQEVDAGSARNGRFDQRSVFSTALALPYEAYMPDRTWARYCNDGNAILSELPLQNEERGVLPYRFEKRTYIKGSLQYGSKAIDVYVTHFGAHGLNKRERCAQAKALHDLIKDRKKSAIVMGDLNCEPKDEEFSILCGKGTLKSSPHALTYPSYRPTKNYDHILCTSDLRIISCRRLELHHSDHLPVVAKIAVQS